MDLDMEEFHNRLYVVRANECPDKLLAELRTPKADKADKEETERANERERESESHGVNSTRHRFCRALQKSDNQPTSNPQMGKQKVSGQKGSALVGRGVRWGSVGDIATPKQVYYHYYFTTTGKIY